jgi:hypothetical protein
MRRNLWLPVLLIAASSFVCGACGMGQTPATNAPTANASGASNANAAGGASDGVGAHGTGIGGTSGDNRDATVAGNSNVEPTGVNKSAGRPTGSTGNAASNSNR